MAAVPVPGVLDPARYRQGVLLVLAVASAGVSAGRLRRPAGGHGARPHLHHLALLAVGIAAVAASVWAPDSTATVLRGLGWAAVTWFAVRNRAVTGIAVAGLGALANLACLVLNNGVPVRAEALVDAGVAAASEVREHELQEPRHLQSGDDAFAWLGEVVPLSATEQVLSFGDLLLLVGGFDALREVTRRRARLPLVGGDDPSDAPGALDDPDPVAATGAAATARGPQPGAMTQASADQDWGTAPSGEPESGSQCSAKPDLTTAEAMEFWRDADVSPSPAHLAARHDK